MANRLFNDNNRQQHSVLDDGARGDDLGPVGGDGLFVLNSAQVLGALLVVLSRLAQVTNNLTIHTSHGQILRLLGPVDSIAMGLLVWKKLT